MKNIKAKRITKSNSQSTSTLSKSNEDDPQIKWVVDCARKEKIMREINASSSLNSFACAASSTDEEGMGC